MHSPPCSATSSVTAAALSSSRSNIAIFAPSDAKSLEVALPIFRPPPTITATLSSNLPMNFLPLGQLVFFVEPEFKSTQ